MTTVQIQQSRGFKLWPLIISILITESIGVTASIFTIPQIPGWYSTLTKPSFTPPNGVFGPVWVSLYLLIGIAAYLVWQHRNGSFKFRRARNVYFLQLILNFSWSMVFFGMEQILGGLIVIALLWLSIVANIFYFYRYSKVAAWLLVPYLLWVSYASMLNLYIYLLNR
jgi:translocator protein